jgi:hypothetical protein
MRIITGGNSLNHLSFVVSRVRYCCALSAIFRVCDVWMDTMFLWTLFQSGFPKASEIDRNYLLEYTKIKINKRVPLFSLTIPLPCRLDMAHLCVLHLETALATLVTTWFTLADRRWRSRYRSSDQCIFIAEKQQMKGDWVTIKRKAKMNNINIHTSLWYS